MRSTSLIATQGVDPVYGARPMKRYIQRNIETLIAKKIIEGGAGKEDTITVDVITVNMKCTFARRSIKACQRMRIWSKGPLFESVENVKQTLIILSAYANILRK